MTHFALVLGLALALGWPLGRYLASVMRGDASRLDGVFGLVERPVYRLLGRASTVAMTWRGYAAAFLASNMALAAVVWLVLMNQGWLPLNPDGIPGMRWDLALHTMVSFLTNTNQQHYSGQTQLSYLSQMTAIVGLQIVTPMMGLALAAATLRAFFHERKGQDADAGAGLDAETASPQVPVGNYWIDVTRACVRFLLPLCLAWSLALASQGVPATLQGGPVAVPADPAAGLAEQKIPLGPVAAMVAAKQLGTNGGGWYGPNSAVPLENPTPLSNLLETLALVLIPVAVAFMVGPFTGRPRFAALVVGTMLLMSTLSTGAMLWTETAAPAGDEAAAMEGKEVRFGADASALWAALTTQTSNGSVNMMHDSAAPLSGLVLMSNMLVNAIWGGVGCGLQQFLVYLLLGVFVCGLMTGRTPELFGRRIGTSEVRLLAVLVLLQPLAVLGMTAAALAAPGLAGNSNPGFHGISQVFYEYVSAYANNGSGFEGLGDASRWWNLSCTLVLALGRYPALLIPLAIAAGMARKRAAPENAGTLRVETPTFALTLVAVIAILTLLQFMPVLVLGPVAESLASLTP